MSTKITILGGGTGSFVVLSALKKHKVDLAAIVTMMDSGGSTGKLRDQLGVLPPGDLRQCLVALSEAPELWRKLFTYRFDKGDFKGHNFGNVMISALQKVTDDYDEVLDELHYLMHCIGRVYPVTTAHANIKVTYSTGRIVDSESLLDERNPDGGHIIDASVVPEVAANTDALSRIAHSDYIIAGPGDLYSSIISISLVKGIREAVSTSKAKLIYIMNLMTKSSQTADYTARDHLRDFAQYFGRMPDICVINTEAITPAMARTYESYGESQVVDDLDGHYAGKVVRADLLDDAMHTSSPSEALGATFAHSIVRHDGIKLERCLQSILGI